MQQHFTDEQFQEYMDKLNANGYVVIKGVLSDKKSNEIRSSFFDSLEKLNSNIKRDDQSTWKGENYPKTAGGIFKNYGIGQWPALWEARTEPAIIEVFQRFWGTKDVTCSFDGASLLSNQTTTLRNEKNAAKKFHTDQAPTLKFTKEVQSKASKYLTDFGGRLKKKSFNSIQGVLNLNSNEEGDGGLYICEKSHLDHEEFFKTNKISNLTKNWYLFQSPVKLEHESDDQYKSRCDAGSKYLTNYKHTKVNAESGDLLLFYSKTTHSIVNPSKDSKNYRLGFYITMFPSELATRNEKARRRDIFNDIGTTSHWPVIKLNKNGKNPQTYGDTKVIENFNLDWLKVPVLSSGAKKIAGLADVGAKRKLNNPIESVMKKLKK